MHKDYTLMPSWYLKAAIQGGLSLLPQSHRWNYLFQRYISKGLRLSDTYFERKLILCRKHREHYYAYQSNPPARIVELGTGWLPIVPVGMALMEEAEILSIDLTPLLRDQLVRETLALFVRYADEGRLEQHLPDLIPQKIEKLRESLHSLHQNGARQALNLLNIRYRVGDARTMPLDSVDLFISNNTLEHIPGSTIQAIFQHFNPLLGTHGLMSHLIDLSDHYSHFDGRITPYHFLRFTSAQWRIYNNALHYQNRLRIPDYRVIHRDAGYEILSEENRAAAPDRLNYFPLAPEFSHYTQDDLAVTSTWMVSRPLRSDL